MFKQEANTSNLIPSKQLHLRINTMANITVKDLVNCTDNGSFIRDLSETELDLQGGGLRKLFRKIFKGFGKVVAVVNAVADLID